MDKDSEDKVNFLEDAWERRIISYKDYVLQEIMSYKRRGS